MLQSKSGLISIRLREIRKNLIWNSEISNEKNIGSFMKYSLNEFAETVYDKDFYDNVESFITFVNYKYNEETKQFELIKRD